MAAILLQACSTPQAEQQVVGNQGLDPEGLFSMPGFHQVMLSQGSKTIYVAGQVAYDSEMNMVGIGDYAAQTTRALQNVALALKAAGAAPEDVVSSTLYIKGLNRQAAREITQAMATALDGQPFPAHAFNMIGIDALADPRALIEITSIAVRQ
ncbi:RidA family protein [Parahaliea sp. F7430]|uniref:RidA family protein n=1 Tax=Sediminihaliea albiluteola TaxID=2758564 RepID=A0A7W2YKL2_9GAMM|nr:Rid family hydrolase [Sediminihaliea albiluteola]MBA6414217.1 RidA family protein [Sediminihaliea albiluteola]